MTISSIAIKKVVGSFQRSLRSKAELSHSEEKPNFKKAMAHAKIENNGALKNMRDRFGEGAVKNYRKASLEIYRRIQDL